ncbi:phage terminase small subunit [Variovorax boronicumulans]|uniref:terminase small subunit n=1 Tax=Variovorax boronicumulans TaxID=436515 RepID=UPI002784F4BA|nr:terminase small subunit [Variovorax boronicumulans]MDQ0084571.1 phage terminase small subunit [Variovorax boronicumulans]
MSALTPKQEAFCVAYIESGNATDAYRKAGYSSGMSDKTAAEAASRLLRNSKVVARLAEVREMATAEAAMTIADHLNDLKSLRDAAKKEGKYSAAVAAEVARGRVSGFYVERVAGSDGGPLIVEIVRHGANPATQ